MQPLQRNLTKSAAAACLAVLGLTPLASVYGGDGTLPLMLNGKAMDMSTPGGNTKALPTALKVNRPLSVVDLGANAAFGCEMPAHVGRFQATGNITVEGRQYRLVGYCMQPHTSGDVEFVAKGAGPQGPATVRLRCNSNGDLSSLPAVNGRMNIEANVTTGRFRVNLNKVSN